MDMIAHERPRVVVPRYDVEAGVPKECDDRLTSADLAASGREVMASDADCVCTADDARHSFDRELLRPFDVHLQEVDVCDSLAVAQSIERQALDGRREIPF